MPKTPKPKSSEQIRAAISKLHPDIMVTHGRHLAAKQRFNFLSEVCISNLTLSKGGGDATLSNLPNHGSHVISWGDSDNGRNQSAIATIIQVLESSQPFKDSREQLLPLLNELELASAAEAEHAAKVSAERSKLIAAKEKAMAEAAAKIEKQFATA